jgi:Tol biopolymer transport system component
MSDSITHLTKALEGRYIVERELGEGGMATVYLAEDVKHHRKVAVKVLKPELAAIVGADRFLAEIETTARLQHPNILPLFDSGEANGFLFYVMPYVAGESLRDRLEREKQLPVDEAVRIATEVAEALHSAHGHGVIHRDIKPANIMVSQGRPLLADFGIALAVSAAGGSRLTETGLSLGTPQYMSPEQATGDQVVGPASDIYSLGCVLYEMLVGEPPYTGSSAQAILGKVITLEPTSVTEQRRAVPAHVDATVAKALEKVPADRFGSARDFAAALADEGFRHGSGVPSAGSASPVVKAVALGGWVAAVALGGLWLASVFGPEPAPPVRTFSLVYAGEAGPSEWMGLTPDGSALILSDQQRSSDFSLVVQRLDDGTRFSIPNSAGGLDPAVSPDGSEVAFGGDELHVAALTGGTVRTLTENAQNVCCIRWGGDGYIYFSLGEGDIHRVRPSGSQSEVVLESAEAEQLGYYQPVGDARRAIVDVLSLENDEIRHRIDWVDIQSGTRHLLVQGRRPFLTEDGHLIFGRGESIYAGLLDTRSMEFVGDPVRMVERVGITQLDAMFTLSESGDLAYWITYGEADARPLRDLIWVDRSGQVTPVDTSFARDLLTAALSPDGTRVAVAVGPWDGSEIWVKELDEGSALRLTHHPGTNYRPAWSPDGREVAFISDRDGHLAVYAVPVAGIATPRLLVALDGEDIDEVAWSPDGDWLIYRTGQVDGGRDVYARRIRPDTMTMAVSAEPDVDEWGPALSPDGRWVAYSSTRTGNNEIWVRPFPDVSRGSRQVSSDIGIEPVWAPSGEELFFRSRPGVTAASVTGGDDFRVSLETMFSNQLSWFNTLHQTYSYDGSEDRFLMIRELGVREIPAELILVQNFMDEVRARLGN